MHELPNSHFLHDRSFPTQKVPDVVFPTRYDYIISDRDLEACQTIHNSLQASRTIQLRVLYLNYHADARKGILAGLAGFKTEQLIGHFTADELSQLLAGAEDDK